MAQTVKRLPTMREIRVQSLDREDLLEKEMATHSSILAWKIPWMEDTGRLHTVHGVARSWTRLSDFTFTYPLWNVNEQGTGSGSHPDTSPEAAVTLNIQEVRRRQRAGSPSLYPQWGHGSILELSAWVVQGSRITKSLGNALISKSAQTSVP